MRLQIVLRIVCTRQKKVRNVSRTGFGNQRVVEAGLTHSAYFVRL